MNPVGKVPVLKDDDFIMFESGAMVQYILDRHGNGQLQPKPGTPEHGRYLQWCWFAESTFARPIGEIVNHRRVRPLFVYTFTERYTTLKYIFLTIY